MKSRTSFVLGLAVAIAASRALAQPDATRDASDRAAPAVPSAPSPSSASSLSSPNAVSSPNAEGASDATRGSFMRAYHAAMQRRKLAASGPTRRADLARFVADAEALVVEGRDTEAIAKLTDVVEHPDFAAYADSEEGRSALYLLGRSLARSGVHESARAYLRRVLASKGAWADGGIQARRAVRALVEIALETRNYAEGRSDLATVPAQAPAEVKAEIDYLSGRAKESSGDVDGALASYAAVPQTSRFWSQATYLSGLLEVERGRTREGENLFCKVADPKRQDRTVPVFADERFFAVRDLARLALGRVAHDQYRFDDARYYYYLVPQDSDRLAEALYESATSRYEKKDYEGARELIRQLGALGVHHRYEDEAWILDAYIDLALCRFAESDAKLRTFLRTYEPVRDAARRFSRDPRGTELLLAAARRGADAGGLDLAGAAVKPEELRTLAMLVRVDPSYVELARERAVLERELGGLRTSLRTIADMRASLSTTGGVRPTVDDGKAPSDEIERARSAVAAVRREIDALSQAHAPADRLAPLRRELAAIEARLPSSLPSPPSPEVVGATPSRDADLPELLASDAALGTSLEATLASAHAEVSTAERALAKDALHRLDLRLSRLLRRARLGRIESVLGKKHALEVEVEALNAGLLPKEALDSLDAARYLRDDEEYWPFEGDDWPDEFVGSEGLR